MASDELVSGDSAAREEQPETAAKRGADRDVGQALRSVYTQTVNEDIPTELLDLLGKLG